MNPPIDILRIAMDRLWIAQGGISPPTLWKTPADIMAAERRRLDLLEAEDDYCTALRIAEDIANSMDWNDATSNIGPDCHSLRTELHQHLSSDAHLNPEGG